MCFFVFSIFDTFLGKWLSDIFSRYFHLTFKILSLERTTSTPHPLTCVTYLFVGRPPPHRFRHHRYVGHKSFVFPTFIDSSWQIWVKSWRKWGWLMIDEVSLQHLRPLQFRKMWWSSLKSTKGIFSWSWKTSVCRRFWSFFCFGRFFFSQQIQGQIASWTMSRACCCSCTKPTNQQFWRPPKFWKPWQNEPQTSWRSDISSRCSSGVSSSGEHLVPFLNIQLAVVYKWKLRDYAATAATKNTTANMILNSPVKWRFGICYTPEN